MTDLATVTAVLSNIKLATDIAKALRQSDVAIEKAELKLKLAEMIGALADAKLEVTDIQELLVAKERHISELEEAFQSKDSLVRHGDAFYAIDGSGLPIGEAFCAHCWQVKHKKYTLHYEARDHFVKICLSCNKKYSARQVHNLAPTNPGTS